MEIVHKPYVTNIIDGWDHPYLGVYCDEVSVYDFADLDKNVERINFNAKVKNLHLLPNFKAVRYVGTGHVTAELIELLSQLPCLEVLGISNSKNENWPSFKPLTGLKYLRLYNIKKITNLDFLKGMTQLQSLYVSEVLKLDDISALKTTPNIRELAVEGNLHGQSSKLPEVEALFSLKKLEFLQFYTKKSILKASDFANFKNLSYLRLSPRRHPFEFYAELEKYLPENCGKVNWPLLLWDAETPCKKCDGQNAITPIGFRQREFCPSCNPKKLNKLLTSYEQLSGNPARNAIDHIPFLNGDHLKTK